MKKWNDNDNSNVWNDNDNNDNEMCGINVCIVCNVCGIINVCV